MSRPLCVLALAATLTVCLCAHDAFAAPTPQETGWTVRKVADGFGLNFNGLAFDPLSTDLFTTDFSLATIFRVSQSGVKTPIYSSPSISYDEMAFDPVARILYFGGVAQTRLRKITDTGGFVEDVIAPGGYTGLAFAPDGRLYLNDISSNRILRYNESDDSFTTAFSGVGSAVLEGLAFDPSSNAYVAGYGQSQVLKVTPSAVITPIASIPGPIGITFGDGSAFVTNWGSEIYRVAPDGSGTTVFANGHVGVAGIHFASNGRLYVNDANSGSLWEYSGPPTNRPPNCDDALALIEELWPPNHKYTAVTIVGVTDPDGDPVTIVATGITQDEPLNAAGDGNTCPDGEIDGDGVAHVRSERSGNPHVPGNGRVYHVSFTATDDEGATCDGVVTVCVPHDQGAGTVCVDDGPLYNSLGPCKNGARSNGEPIATTDLTVRTNGRQAVLEYSLAEEADVNLSVFDLAGRRVATIENARKGAGTYAVTWEAGGLAQGLYFYRLQAGNMRVARSVLHAE